MEGGKSTLPEPALTIEGAVPDLRRPALSGEVGEKRVSGPLPNGKASEPGRSTTCPQR